MEEVQQFLKECGIYYLATIDGNKPKVRPFGTAEIFENHLYVQTGKSKKVYNQIKENPYVELCGFKDGKWIRVSGKLIEDDRVEARKDMLDKNPDLRNMYDENDDNTVVLYFEKAIATIYSFTENPKTIEF
ncbi:MAG: pyridoxamine 5'-phosphate oxidase family protein [Bacilli bacterium]|nr:pyridoxamine 5'-phosphate oxidase family protein [Bacilli bacterium]MBO6195577.1 pyridoxamine 5'-phosphate oxidase family protein [Bacilli bacterium]